MSILENILKGQGRNVEYNFKPGNFVLYKGFISPCHLS